MRVRRRREGARTHNHAQTLSFLSISARARSLLVSFYLLPSLSSSLPPLLPPSLPPSLQPPLFRPPRVCAPPRRRRTRTTHTLSLFSLAQRVKKKIEKIREGARPHSAELAPLAATRSLSAKIFILKKSARVYTSAQRAREAAA